MLFKTIAPTKYSGFTELELRQGMAQREVELKSLDGIMTFLRDDIRSGLVGTDKAMYHLRKSARLKTVAQEELLILTRELDSRSN